MKFPAIARAQVLGETGGTVSEEAVRKRNRTIPTCLQGAARVCVAHAARRRGGNAFTRQLRTRRRVGTQAWIDPVKGVAYVLMVQRSNFPNSDASDVRREFQKAAATKLSPA